MTMEETIVSEKDQTKILNALRTRTVIDVKRVHIHCLIHIFFYVSNLITKTLKQLA